jgi:uncharacterized membrane protein YkoI
MNIKTFLIGGGLAASTMLGGAVAGAMTNGVASAQTSDATTSTTSLVEGIVDQVTGAADATTSTTVAPAASDDATTATTVPKADGPHTANGKTETELTGADAEKAKAAALEAVPGGTIERVETDADGDAYEVHMHKADGTPVTVKLDENFKVTSVEEGRGDCPDGAAGGGRDGGRHHRGPGDGTQPSDDAAAADATSNT